jgi:biopolymer transport protein ExbD
MAFSLHDDDSPEEMAEINVTPFIDVMLVLLIIFMVAAPLSTVDIPIDLPGQTAPATPREDEPVFLTINAENELFLGEIPVPPAGLASALEQATGGDAETRLYLRADSAVPYGALMAVMDDLRGAGYRKVALVALEDLGDRP